MMRDLTTAELLALIEAADAKSIVVLTGAPGEKTVVAMAADRMFVQRCIFKLMEVETTMPTVIDRLTR